MTFQYTPSKRSLIFKTLDGWGAFNPEIAGITDIVNSKELYLGKVKGVKYWNYKSRFSDFGRMYLGVFINFILLFPFLSILQNHLILCSQGSIFCIRSRWIVFLIFFLYMLNLILLWHLTFIGANKKFKYILDKDGISFHKHNYIDKIKYSQIRGVIEELSPETLIGKLVRFANLGMMKDRTIRVDYEENKKIYSFRLFGVPEEIHSKILKYLINIKN